MAELNLAEGRKWVRETQIKVAAAKLVSRNGKVTMPIRDVEEILQAFELLLDELEAAKRELAFR